MQKYHARRATAKAARIDRRPAIALTAISILASLLLAHRFLL